MSDFAQRWGLAPVSANGWTAEIADRWRLPDRVFGGYSAALCTAATLVGAAPEGPEDQQLLSAAVAFLAPVVPGAVEFEVTPVRRGRRVSWLTGVGRQRGRPVISSMVAVTPGTGVGTQTEDIRPPDGLPDLAYLAELSPFFRNFDERAVDYPPSFAEYFDGKDRLDVWIRARDPLFRGDPLSEQLADLAFADAHLLDANCRSTGVPLDQAFSIDLQLTWVAEPPISAWRHVLIEGPAGGPFAACRADVLAADGTLRAWATQRAILG